MTEAEREALRANWRRLSGSTMAPIATSLAVCPSCGRVYGVIDGKLNEHNGWDFDPRGIGVGGGGWRCRGSGAAVEGRPL